MARLARYTQNLFASTATTNQIAEFGSLAAGSPARYSGSTITPAIVQTLSNYLSGWFAAVEGAYSPAIEDENALDYLFSYQLSYMLQLGIPEWSSTTTYYAGSIVQDGIGTLYVSIQNTNLNNALTVGTFWAAPPLPGVIVPNAVPYAAGMTLVSGQSMTWAYMQIGSGQTVVVPSGASLIGITSIVLTGTAVLQATGTGVIRAL